MKLNRIVLLWTNPAIRKDEINLHAAKLALRCGFIQREEQYDNGHNKGIVDIVDVRKVMAMSYDEALADTFLVARRLDHRYNENSIMRMLGHATAWKKAVIRGAGLNLFIEDTAVLNTEVKADMSSVVCDFDVCFVDGTLEFDGNEKSNPAKFIIPERYSEGSEKLNFPGAYFVKGLALQKLIDLFTPVACTIEDLAYSQIVGMDVDRMGAFRQTQESYHSSAFGRRNLDFRVWHNAFIPLSMKEFTDTIRGKHLEPDYAI